MMRVIPRERRGLRQVGVVVLVALALGAAGHFWHHLSDRACERPDQGRPHPCAQCSALHGGVLAEESQRAVPPGLSAIDRLVLLDDGDRAVALRGGGSPRAPPLG
jgi:hypothetical protein